MRVPLIMTIIGVCLLIFLGTWQVYRLQWKQNLIQDFHDRLTKPAQDIKNLLFSQAPVVEFTPVQVTGSFLKDFKLKLQGRSLDGQIGYHLIMAIKQSNDVIILVDRGWIPLAETYKTVDLLPVTLKGYTRPKSDHNFMTPSNRYDRGEIYQLDPLDIAQHANLKNVAPLYVVETGPIVKGVYPSPAQLVLHLRNNHLQYAIIWYTLALALIVVYILFQRQSRKIVRP